MDEDRLWDLFFATGLPEVYLAVRGEREEKELRMQLSAKTAFQPEDRSVRQI